MADEVSKNMEYLLMYNIPETYHASDLRDFFSHFVETSRFDCFHFRHRPQTRLLIIKCIASSPRSTCCVVRVKRSSDADELLRTYHGMHWLDRDGSTLPKKCFISKIDCDQASGRADGDNLTKELEKLVEFHPPVLMPNGNVGTPTQHFWELIRACRLPAYLVSKLGLEFPRSRKGRLYSRVPPNYKGRTFSSQRPKSPELPTTGRGHFFTPTPVQRQRSPERDSQSTEEASTEPEEEAEEWDRHESLHEDVTQQGRTRERLFEEKIELKWEKGGSGLVFYTDSQFWQETDFDEITADDWDVDTSLYYGDDGDKDAHDLLDIRRETGDHLSTSNDIPTQRKQRTKRKSQSLLIENQEDSKKTLGGFEKHTKGIGRRILEKHGWKDGSGLGKSVKGIAQPIQDQGQSPWNKHGFGYRGSKLERLPWKNQKQFLVSTVYDDSSLTDPQECLLQSNPPTQLKHRLYKAIKH